MRWHMVSVHQFAAVAKLVKAARSKRADCGFESCRRHQGPASGSRTFGRWECPAPCSIRQVAKAAVLHTAIPRFESSMEHHAPLAQWQECLLDMQKVRGSIPRGRTILVTAEATSAPDKRVQRGAVPRTRTNLDGERKPEWRGSGLLTRPHVDHNHRRPPKPRSDALWDPLHEQWVILITCPCCKQCWIAVDDNGIGAKCIHGGPYKGYIKVPDEFQKPSNP